MNAKSFAITALAIVAGLGIADQAQAQVGPKPGSLLVFPEFDNRDGVANIITVTNTNKDHVNGDIAVEFIYLNKYDCQEFNRVEYLTPNDTVSVLTYFHNPQQEQGYVYVFARDIDTWDVVAFDWLIGSSLVVDGPAQYQYSTNPFVFQAGAGLSTGDATDLDGDGERDLDGAEYVRAPDEILIPRFVGQSYDRRRESDLILINLTGGAQFYATADFLIYNDNEEAFSANYTFHCWKKVKLTEISSAFENDFLANYTNDDPYEVAGLTGVETGWINIDGGVASSYVTSIPDPALLALMIERVGDFAAADLPFCAGTQGNGSLLGRGVTVD